VRLRRWLFAAIGALCVAAGAVGAVVPGLPTTVFLLAACWFFARSCPRLEEGLRNSRFLGAYLRMTTDGMPRRAKAITVAAIWTATAAGVAGPLAEASEVARLTVAVLAAAGTWAVVRLVPGSRPAA
jgi:uncharacterized membrane protein YbaN (DUF454 family)